MKKVTSKSKKENPTKEVIAPAQAGLEPLLEIPEITTHLDSCTINKQDLETFNNYEGSSWDPEGSFKPIHELNPVRLSFIKNHLSRLKNLPTENAYAGLSMLDVGCGPGILCEPLARLGADVTGIDANDRFLNEAKTHAASQNLTINYEHKPIEACQGKLYDVVLALEVVEHVNNPDVFLNACMNVLKPGGVLFISTLNRTPISYVKAIVLAEYILKWVPYGTHDWKRFLTPSEIGEILRKNNFFFTDLKGIDYNPLKKEWNLISSLNTNYIGCAVKR